MHNRTTLIFVSLLAGCTAGTQIPVGTNNPTEGGAETAEIGEKHAEPVFHSFGPIDGVHCVGHVGERPVGAKHIQDEALAKASVDATGNGKLCEAKVYEAIAPVKVYRVWTKEKPASEKGRWWALTRPRGTVEEYRKEYAICPEWNDLNMVTVCTLKVGAHFAMGPGQSAKCEHGTYEKSPVNQVYISDTALVENCERLGAFP